MNIRPPGRIDVGYDDRAAADDGKDEGGGWGDWLARWTNVIENVREVKLSLISGQLRFIRGFNSFYSRRITAWSMTDTI